jgi:hypothetical protein
VVIGEPLRGYRALTSGIPEPWSIGSGQQDPELRQPPDESSPRPKKPRRRSGQ